MDISNESKQLNIPITIRIGVTGHRKLTKEQVICDSVKSILSRLDKMLSNTPHTFVAVSPLAEGADRLVAKEIMTWQISENKPILEAVLPLHEAEYLQDFETAESRNEFNELLSMARTIPPSLEKGESREVAYERAGHYVVDNCDILIAIWDGKPAAGQGGTAEIVEYARKVERHIFWINSENGKIEKEKNKDHLLESYKHLDTYNSEILSDEDYNSGLKEEYDSLSKHAEKKGIQEIYLQPLRHKLLPHYVRTDLLAMKYQKSHMGSGIWIYTLAAFSVVIVTLYMLFFQDFTKILFAEFVSLILILLLLILAHIKEWQRKWIDYRFLAERFRIAIFLCVVGMNCKIPKLPPFLDIPHLQDDWTIKEFSEIWNCRLQIHQKIPFDSLKKFLQEAWIKDQITFYKNTSKKHGQKNNTYEIVGTLLFALTILVSLTHAFELENYLRFHLLYFPNILVSLAIIFPTTSAALAGIRVHREYLRNAERYSHMARYLSAISEKIKQAKDMEELESILEEVNEMIFLENWDWRAAFWLRKVEAP